MRPDDLAALNEEIAGMARAGLPLDQGLASLAREMGRGRLRRVTAAIAEDLREGRTLSEALDRQKGRVPTYYSSLVAAGVRTGRVAEVLATLTTYARSVADLRTIVLDALLYPAIVLAFSAAILAGLSYFILPQFEEIFRDFRLELPAVTQTVFWIGQRPLLFFVLPLLALPVVLVVSRLILRYTPGGNRAWARLVYSVPVIGTLIRSARLASFTDLLAILVDHQVPLPEAFRLAGDAASDPLVGAAAGQIHHDLSQGRPLGEVLRGRGLVPEWVAWMTAQGEQRGRLGDSLRQIATMYRRQVEARVPLLRTILPPFLVLITAGVFVVFFVFTLILPMIKLIEGIMI